MDRYYHYLTDHYYLATSEVLNDNNRPRWINISQSTSFGNVVVQSSTPDHPSSIGLGISYLGNRNLVPYHKVASTAGLSTEYCQQGYSAGSLMRDHGTGRDWP